MLSLGEIAARTARVAALIIGMTIVWYLGIAISKFRGEKPNNVIWYEGSVLGVGLLGVPFGIAAIAARLSNVPGWNSDIAWLVAALCFADTLLMALIVFRYKIIVLDDMLIETRVLRLGNRRVDWKKVRGWRAGAKAGSVILELDPQGKFEFAPIFKEGSEALFDALDAHGISEI
jgi:hypothetical protein